MISVSVGYLRRVWSFDSREQGAYGSSQQDNIISGLDGSRKGRLVAIEP